LDDARPHRETVNLIEALEVLKQPVPAGSPSLRVALACGFTPLHLQTFLAAHLRQRMPDRGMEIVPGLFGDLAGNIERFAAAKCDALAVAMEWADLDARLGTRTLGGWRAENLPDIVKSADLSLSRIAQALRKSSGSFPVCICLPTLPLPPLFAAATRQAGAEELQLRSCVASFAANIAKEPFVRIVSSQQLDELFGTSKRFNLQSELTAGFPYQLPHASTMADLLAALIHNPSPKKGLITDLDDTVWAGILGEVGVEGISWDLDRHSHMHGVYQQFLGSLASAGVLIGVASKNDPARVAQALERKDLILPKDKVFPIEAHWSAKSESAGRILKTWNIGPEAVVFIDDSAMEVAEVKAAFPEMQCIVFPHNDPGAIWDLLKQLRNLFGKTTVSPEDLLRMESIRAAGALREAVAGDGSSADDFLQNAGAEIEFSFAKQPRDTRAFDLINKTNQFNLNGKRLTEAAWQDYLNDPAAFLMTVSYEDKYGPLGKIAVLLGKIEEQRVSVDFWVMSCRAFSRRIEYQCLKQLCERFDATEVVFDYQATPRNGPLQEFFAGIAGSPLPSQLHVSRSDVQDKSPALFHRVKELVNA
jgi:FkbH-like protein